MFRLLNKDEIDVRIAQIDKTWCTLLLYKDARVDQDILDETVGVMNWKKDYQLIDGQLFCTISIWDDEKQQWIGKQDVGVESFSQEEKGRASDAQKRSAFCFGIGRELYTAPSIFIFPKKEIKYKNGGKEVDEFFEYKDGKYTTKTRFYVDYIDYDENRKIKDLLIRDDKNNIRFEELSEETAKERNKKILKFKKLIEENEEKDENFEREKVYEHFKAKVDSQIKWDDLDKAIKLLEKRLKECEK